MSPPKMHKPPATEHSPLKHTDLHQLRGHSLSKLMVSPEKIPAQPGVYIWRYWPSLRSLDTDHFEEVLTLWQERQPIFWESIGNSRVRADIGRYPFGQHTNSQTLLGIDKKSEKGKRFFAAMQESRENRDSLFGLLECIISAMPPLYIGKADNLRARLDDHFNGRNSNVIAMIREQQIDINDVFVSYFLDTVSIAKDKSITTVLEEIAQRLTNPPFTKRIG